MIPTRENLCRSQGNDYSMRQRIKGILGLGGLCILVLSCSDERALLILPDSVIEIPELTVTGSCGADPLGGEGGKGYLFTLSNISPVCLHRCILEVNDAYTAGLEKVEVYEGFWGGNVVRNDSDIPSGAKINLVFSHDNNNNLVFRNEKGDMLPRDCGITTLSIHTEEGTNRWTFTDVG